MDEHSDFDIPSPNYSPQFLDPSSLVPRNRIEEECDGGFKETSETDGEVDENDVESEAGGDDEADRNLTNESDGHPNGFVMKVEKDVLEVEESGELKKYNMRLYKTDQGNDDTVYTCLGKVKENEIYVPFEALKLRVDHAHKDKQLELYRVDHCLEDLTHLGYHPLPYFNQFYQPMESPFLVVLSPLYAPPDYVPKGGPIRSSGRLKQPPTTFASAVSEMQRNKESFASYMESRSDLSSNQQRKDWMKQEKERVEIEKAQKMKDQLTKQFIKNQRTMYQSRLVNSGNATGWSAKARFRTHLPEGITPSDKLKLYITIRDDLVQYIKSEGTVQKWLDDFLKRTNQQKFELIYATGPTGPNTLDLNSPVTLRIHDGPHISNVPGLVYLSCHPAQFYTLYVHNDWHAQLRGAPVKRDGSTQYHASWKLPDNYNDIAEAMKGLKNVVETMQKIDSPNSDEPQCWTPWLDSNWNEQGDGNTHTCVSSVKYGMAQREKRKKQQKDLMGCSATQIAKDVWGKVGVGIQNRTKWKNTAEWLHRSGFRMGGLGATIEAKPTQTSQSAGNLVFGSKEANTAMIRYEDAAARMVEYWERARYEVHYPPDETIKGFVKKHDKMQKDGSMKMGEWYQASLKRCTFKQWLDVVVKAAKDKQNDANIQVPPRPPIDEKLHELIGKLEAAESADMSLNPSDRERLKKERNKALKNRAWHSTTFSDIKVYAVNSYAHRHGHLSTSLLTVSNIPMMLDLYDALLQSGIFTSRTANWCKLDKTEKDTFIRDAAQANLGPKPKDSYIVNKEILDKLDQKYQDRWRELELFEQHRVVALTGWIAKTLKWDFVIDFPSRRKADGTVEWDKTVTMCTEFDLNSRYTPLVMETQLDEQFDTALWNGGFFKAAIAEPPKAIVKVSDSFDLEEEKEEENNSTYPKKQSKINQQKKRPEKKTNPQRSVTVPTEEEMTEDQFPYSDDDHKFGQRQKQMKTTESDYHN